MGGTRQWRPCVGCGMLVRRENKSGRCRPCMDAARRPPSCDPAMWRRAEAAIKLLRDGEADGELLLAAVVWPELQPPAIRHQDDGLEAPVS